MNGAADFLGPKVLLEHWRHELGEDPLHSEPVVVLGKREEIQIAIRLVRPMMAVRHENLFIR